MVYEYITIVNGLEIFKQAKYNLKCYSKKV